MDVREKLVELLKKAKAKEQSDFLFADIDDAIDMPNGDEYLANYLIARGVTVQEWISVKDERKPNHGDIALCYMTFGEYRLLQWDDRSKLWVGDYMDYGFEDAAYWQMPQPPKGE